MYYFTNGEFFDTLICEGKYMCEMGRGETDDMYEMWRTLAADRSILPEMRRQSDKRQKMPGLWRGSARRGEVLSRVR